MRKKKKMNLQAKNLLDKVIRYTRNGEVVLKTFKGPLCGIIQNVIIHSNKGSFYLKFSLNAATTEGFDTQAIEIADWEIDAVDPTFDNKAIKTTCVSALQEGSNYDE